MSLLLVAVRTDEPLPEAIGEARSAAIIFGNRCAFCVFPPPARPAA